jgi:hypothetical protein
VFFVFALICLFIYYKMTTHTFPPTAPPVGVVLMTLFKKSGAGPRPDSHQKLHAEK